MVKLPRTFLSKRNYLFLIFGFVIMLCWYRNKFLSMKAYTQESESLLDFKNFLYLIKNDICAGNVFLIILIHSAPNHFNLRNLIRSTWGKPNPDLPIIKVAFLLAAAHEYQEDIEQENTLYNDIIQGNFIDSYRNLTYKHAMGLLWASQNCSNARYLLKMDDDIFMDIYKFIYYIKNQLQNSDLKNNIACYYQNGMPVVRDHVSKWYVSKKEYASDYFESYCSGWAYLTTVHTAGLLYQKAKNMPYFWVDDVHITGTVAKEANITHIKTNKLYALEADELMEWSSSPKDLQWDKVFAPMWGDLVLGKRAHKKALHCYMTKCSCCYTRKVITKPPTLPTTVRGIAKLLPLSFQELDKKFIERRISKRNKNLW